MPINVMDLIHCRSLKKMKLLEELKSGSFYIYAQWSAILSLIAAPLFSIFTWIFAFVVLCLEFPIFIHFFRSGSSGERFLLQLQEPIYHAGIYAIFSALMWISCGVAITPLIVPAALLTCSTGFYAVAYFRKEAKVRSKLTFGQESTTEVPQNIQVYQIRKIIERSPPPSEIRLSEI